MGSTITKNEKKPRPRIKAPPNLRKLSKNYENFQASSSEIIVSTLNNNIEPIEFADCSSITNENDARQLVDDVWRLIDRQTTKQTPVLKEKSLKANVVRIFVSSTSVDFHSERILLNKEVFPELRDWCAEKGLILTEFDIRCGVPVKICTSGTVEISMHALDVCHKETQGHPFFLGLIGDRYGSVPGKDNLTEELRRNYDWVPNVSITHMEVLHGAYRCKNPNAFFLLRDSASLNDVPSEFRKDFEENSVLSKLQLEELKKRLRSRFVNGCFDYSPVFDGFDESSGRKLVKFKGNEKFVESIKTFFKKRITAAFSLEKRNESDSADVSMLLKQEQFVQDSSDWFVGRVEELKALHAFVEGSEALNITKLPNEINDESKYIYLFGKVPWSVDNSTPYLFVKGKSGFGKSSLLAKFVAECFKKRHSNHIFYQFLGLDDASGNEENLLKRLIRFSGVKNLDSNENDRNKLIEIWKEKALANLAASKNELIIVLDAINKTSWSQSASHLKWLPRCFPKNVRCIVSSDADDIPTTSRCEEIGPYCLDLNLLSKNEQKFFVDSYLTRFGKTLDTNQMNDLIVRDRTPVWLWLACEELRVINDFRDLKCKINSFPDDITDLSWYIVERLIRDDVEKRKNHEKFLNFLKLFIRNHQIDWISKCDVLFAHIFQFCLIVKDKNPEFFSVHSLDIRLQSILDASLEKTVDDPIRQLTSKLLNLLLHHGPKRSTSVPSNVGVQSLVDVHQSPTPSVILRELDKKILPFDRRVVRWLEAINEDDRDCESVESIFDDQNCYQSSSKVNQNNSILKRCAPAEEIVRDTNKKLLNRRSAIVQSPTDTNFYSCGSISSSKRIALKRKFVSNNVVEDSDDGSSGSVWNKCCCCREAEASASKTFLT